MGFDQVKAGKDVPNDINVIIEISAQGDPIKFEVDKDSGAVFVDRFMGTSMRYPINYGYVPHTVAGDGDRERDEGDAVLAGQIAMARDVDRDHRPGAAGQLGARQRRAGGQLQGKDGRTQPFKDLRGGLAGAVELVGCFHCAGLWSPDSRVALD